MSVEASVHVSVHCLDLTVAMRCGSFCAHRANSKPDCSKRFVDKNSKVAEPHAGDLLSLWSSTVTRCTSKSVQDIKCSCPEVRIFTATEPEWTKYHHGPLRCRCHTAVQMMQGPCMFLREVLLPRQDLIRQHVVHVTPRNTWARGPRKPLRPQRKFIAFVSFHSLQQ